LPIIAAAAIIATHAFSQRAAVMFSCLFHIRHLPPLLHTHRALLPRYLIALHAAAATLFRRADV